MLMVSLAALATRAPARPGSDPHTTARTTVRAGDLTAMFAVLRQSPIDEVPPLVREFASSPAGDDYGLSVEETREVKPADGGAPMYVLPGSKGLCFYTNHVGGCTSLENAAAGKLFVVGTAPSDKDHPAAKAAASRVIGVVPDDVVAVSAISANGRADDSVTRSVASNTYNITGAAADSIRFIDSTGESATVELGG
jgi:hypothetical protein